MPDCFWALSVISTDSVESFGSLSLAAITADFPRRKSTPMTHPKKSAQPRATARVNATLEKRLISYVTAASAAGIALSAAPQASAKIVYTAANITVTGGTTLDLNGDGIADFSFVFEPGIHSSALAINRLTIGNSILCGLKPPCVDAEAAGLAQAVGPLRGFAGTSYTNAFSGRGVFMAFFIGYGGQTYFIGPWANVSNHYVGFKFLIAGKVHYGWARMSVGNWNNGGAVTISGYAYETIPNQRIFTGQESGLPAEESSVPASASQPAGASLGALAGGAGTLPLWRREIQ